MDHQQNYEYTDPNSYGFINTFTGSEAFMLGQSPQGQQHMNGKAHDMTTELPSLQTFVPGNPATSQYIAQPQPMMFHVDPPQQPAALYPLAPDAYHHMATLQPELTMSSQKDSMFNMESPPVVVPASIIQESEVAEPPQMDLIRSDEVPPPSLDLIPSEIAQPDLIQSSHPPAEESPAPSTMEPESFENTADADKTSPIVFSPEQNNMMKALGVVRKDVLAPVSGSKKRRRRILQLNEDDSDDDSELKKELLQISPEKDKEKENDADTEDSSADSESDDPSANDPGALKARFLLKSAVIIQGPESKKRKKRVLESDDEDEMQTSVDDIGLMETNENENDDEMFGSDIVVSETTFDPMDDCEKSADEPIMKDGFVVPAPPAPLKPEIVELPTETESLESKPKVKKEKEETEGVEEVKRVIKTEDGEIDPSMSVEAILENIKPMADDDEFFKVGDKSDDSDCQFVSNEEYFGTPDLSKLQPSGRRRGPKPGFSRRQRRESGRRKRSNKYEKDNFVEGSSESEDTSYSESSSASSDSSCEEVRPKGRPVVKKSPIIVQTRNFSVTRVPIKRKITKKDRFYDRSRDIPNDVYFGDVKVPLHVLHTRWNSDAESSDSSGSGQNSYARQSSANRFSNIPRPSFVSKIKPSYSSYFDLNDDPKLTTLKEFAKISGIKINYARLFDGIRSTDDKCMLIRRILAQKGLQGEPTIAKCKQLRLDLQAKRESAELDKSLIIRAEGRTRRATRNLGSSKSSFSSQPSTSSSTTIQPETLQTLSKIRRVVDSDSE